MRLIFRWFLLWVFVAGCGLAAAERLRVNDKPAPEDRRDLEAIQAAVTAALPRARAATVCVDLGAGSGSGVIVSADGLVLTAAHVTARVGKKATVVLEDGRRVKAQTLGLVADKDAAMVRIEEPGPWPFVEVDKDQSLRLGDWVFALGHSGGFDKERGSVVRLGRIVRMAQSTFQSDCLLIGGDSGGPLFDLSGRLVAIHSRVGHVLQENLHVPTAEFLQQWDAMLRSEFVGEGPYASKPVKGSGFLGLATESRDGGGLRVTKVGKDSPAAAAGIREGDVIVSFNGKRLAERRELQEQLKELAMGDEVVLEVERGGKVETLKFELGER